MPKSSKIINDFSGGLNKRKDPKDLEDNEYSESYGVVNTTEGKLSPLGDFQGTDMKLSYPTGFFSGTTGSGDNQSCVLSDSEDLVQGYGLLAFNMDTLLVNKLATTSHDFSSATWAEDSGGTTESASTNYDVTNDNWDLVCGQTADDQAGIKWDASGLSPVDGDLYHVMFSIAAGSNCDYNNRVILYVFLGGADNNPAPANCIYSSDGSTYADTGGTIDGGHDFANYINDSFGKAMISCVGEWGSAGDYIQIVAKRADDNNAVSITMTIDDFSIRRVDKKSANIDTVNASSNFAVQGTEGTVDLFSAIKHNSYTGDKYQIHDPSGINFAANIAQVDRSDMDYSNGFLTVSNGEQIGQFGIVDRNRKVLASSSINNYYSRALQKVHYNTVSISSLMGDAAESPLAYPVDDRLTMELPFFYDSVTALGRQITGGVTGIDTVLDYIPLRIASVNYTSLTFSSGAGLQLWYANPGSGTTALDDMKKVWYTGVSMLLDDDYQEGKISWSDTTANMTGYGNMPAFYMAICHQQTHGFKCWDPRVTGFRVWISESPEAQDPLLLVDADLVNLRYTIYGSTHLNHSFANAGREFGMLGPSDQSAGIQLDTVPSIKFSEFHGYGSTESTAAVYKTSTVIGAHKYIGNVKQNGIYYPDRVLRSEEFSFLVFPENNFIDVIANDGDEITGLMGYGEDLLVFKKGKVYSINPIPEEEALNDEWIGIGVLNSSQICKTEYGVLWINTSGLYLYDGELTNLLIDKMPEKNLNIAANRALSLIDESDGITIGYSPEDKKAFFTYGEANQNFTVYDFKTETVHQGLDTFGTSNSEICTNFVLAQSVYNNRTYLAYGSKTKDGDGDGPDTHMEIWHWDDGPVSSGATEGNYFWSSKIMDFGSPSTRKKVYGVYITYKSAGTYADDGTANVMPMFEINGVVRANPTAFRDAAIGGDGDGVFSNEKSYYVGTTDDAIFKTGDYYMLNKTGGEWKTVYLKPLIPANLNNIYSFQFALINKGAVDDSFEVNDITVIYRDKAQK